MDLNFAPRITISALKGLGLLKHPYPQHIHAVIGDLHLEFVCKDRHSISIIWQYGLKKLETFVYLYFVFCNPGVHHYFICPITRRHVRELYIVDDLIASAEGHGVNTRSDSYRELRKVQRVLDRLAGENGARKARGSNRRELLSQLEVLPLEIRASPVVNLAISTESEALRRKERNQARSTARGGANSTEAALALGALREPWDEAVAAERARSARPSQVLRCEPRQLDWSLVEASPALDIRALMSLRRGSVWGGPLAWRSDLSPENANFFVSVDFRLADRPYVLIEGYPTDLSPRWSQTIELVRSPPSAPERWFMICPITQTRNEILYYRAWLFASRKAQRLRYASQS